MGMSKGHRGEITKNTFKYLSFLTLPSAIDLPVKFSTDASANGDLRRMASKAKMPSQDAMTPLSLLRANKDLSAFQRRYPATELPGLQFFPQMEGKLKER